MVSHMLLQSHPFLKQVRSVTHVTLYNPFCSSMHLWTWAFKRVPANLTNDTHMCHADSDADDFAAMERRMWADVKRPTWEEGSHERSSVVPINPSRTHLPDFLQKVRSTTFH